LGVGPLTWPVSIKRDENIFSTNRSGQTRGWPEIRQEKRCEPLFVNRVVVREKSRSPFKKLSSVVRLLGRKSFAVAIASEGTGIPKTL
jgi:hypothetical protein